MAESADLRLQFLRDVQNIDGGWGYFPGKESWLEPTAYAMLALSGDPSSQPAFDRGWRLMRSWRLPDGSWPACARVREPHWSTALCVILHAQRKVHDEAFTSGVNWLLGVTGTENSWLFRIALKVRPGIIELDPSFRAWPWRPGTSSWIEPTAHAVVALKYAAQAYGAGKVRGRIGDGERMLLERRCSDGGWNYGNRRVLGEDLPSYPETTALALHGLQGNYSLDLRAPLALARKLRAGTRSPLARAWLTLALRDHSVEVADRDPVPLSNDVMIAAVETIGATGTLKAPGGVHQ